MDSVFSGLRGRVQNEPAGLTVFRVVVVGQHLEFLDFIYRGAQAVASGDKLISNIRSVHVIDRKSTRLNSSHGYISYAVFCLKKKIGTQSRPHALTLTSWWMCERAADVRERVKRQCFLAPEDGPVRLHRVRGV